MQGDSILLIGHDSGSSSPIESRSRAASMTSATVSNPCKITEKGRSYVVYTISSYELPIHVRSSFSNSNDCVYRRYSDFTWLNKEISRQFPLGNMPFLPEKQTLGRFDINFLETRRQQLEKYSFTHQSFLSPFSLSFVQVFMPIIGSPRNSFVRNHG